MMMRNGGDGDEAGKGNVNGDEAGKGNVDGDELLKKFDFPEGYKFKPTDEEVIKYYLIPKINKRQLPPNSFKDVNIYSFNPWELSERYKSSEDTIFFFSPRERKYRNGKRPNRAADGGYWKPVGKKIPIIDEHTNKEIGYKSDLTFYLGKPSKGDSQMKEMPRRTDWGMHEYTLKKPKGKEEKNKPNNMQLDEFVVCKLYTKQRRTTEDMAVDVDVDVDADIPPSIDTPTTLAAAPESENQYPLTSAAVAEEMVPENHHYKCQTDVAAAADHQYRLTSMVVAPVPGEMMPENHHYMYQTDVAAPADHQYRLTSMVVAPVPGEMMPENHHYMCQTNAAAADDHQYPLTSMVAAAVPEEMMSFDYNYYYLDNANPSSSSSAILPSVNHQYYGEIDQHQFQSAIVPSVDHQYYCEMNQQQLQLQSATLPSANYPYNGNGEVNQQQLQSATLPSANHYYNGNGEVNQQQLQEEILQEDGIGEMNQEELQLHAEILQQLQEEISPSVNHHSYGQMNQQQQQQQQQEEYEWNMLVTEMNNTGSHPTSMVQQSSPP